MGLNTTLNAKPREVSSSNHARRVRNEGLLPVVFYGGGLPAARSLTVDYAEFKKAFLGSEGNRFLFTISVDGESSPALLKDYQVDPVSRRVLHVDFQKIDPKKPVAVPVPLSLVGKPMGVERGGQLQQGEREITVSGLPEAIPSLIEADVSPLGLGQTMHLTQIKLPESLTLVRTADLPVAVIAVPKGLKAEADAASGATPGAQAAEKKAGPEKKKGDKKK
ncbi:MAG: 50S ribosomal protein L25 [Deltaproteobacteria bacterium]|jgi:large subunit ribosomal protein L25|nr:50S ribosomal protein L25 [Deltaproteobacteria bacterium]